MFTYSNYIKTMGYGLTGGAVGLFYKEEDRMNSFLVECFVAGMAASLACGLGALPLCFKTIDLENRVGLGYGFAGGLMFSASVYNLILPGLTLGSHGQSVLPVLKLLGASWPVVDFCGFWTEPSQRSDWIV